MEKEEKNKYIRQVFTFLMRTTLQPTFSFPGGGVAQRTVDACLDELQEYYSQDFGPERITDYCICQVYAISGYDKNYLRKWKVNHSFGKKATQRFVQSTRGRKFYEDRWLKANDISRQVVCDMFRDRSKHPLFKFIYPEYEESAKRRMHNSEVGFYLCLISTLLWTPFSPSCRDCKNSQRCIEVIRKKYGELYRIRKEAYQTQDKK